MIARLPEKGIQWLEANSETENMLAVQRKLKIIAWLKTEKGDDPKNLSTISLLCHMYMIYELVFLHRLSLLIEPQVVQEQEGIRAGK